MSEHSSRSEIRNPHQLRERVSVMLHHLPRQSEVFCVCSWHAQAEGPDRGNLGETPLAGYTPAIQRRLRHLPRSSNAVGLSALLAWFLDKASVAVQHGGRFSSVLWAAAAALCHAAVSATAWCFQTLSRDDLAALLTHAATWLLMYHSTDSAQQTGESAHVVRGLLLLGPSSDFPPPSPTAWMEAMRFAAVARRASQAALRCQRLPPRLRNVQFCQEAFYISTRTFSESGQSSSSRSQSEQSESDRRYEETGEYDTQDKYKRVGNPISWANPTGGGTVEDNSSKHWTWVYPAGAFAILAFCVISRWRSLRKEKEEQVIASPRINMETGNFGYKPPSQEPLSVEDLAPSEGSGQDSGFGQGWSSSFTPPPRSD
ncbi:unnamed protein product [Symbiodinium sp. KB8]|nr:unnamed protein product [Symbiodinium sp. KB8]